MKLHAKREIYIPFRQGIILAYARLGLTVAEPPYSTRSSPSKFSFFFIKAHFGREFL